jgi:quercetin dioxygenase-like cupin family protein
MKRLIKKVKRNWGYEYWIENNEKYCGKILVCGNKWSDQGKSHYHKKKDETFLVIEGALILDTGINVLKLNKYESFRVRPGIKHRFKALEKKCIFVEISTTHKDSDSYWD